MKRSESIRPISYLKAHASEVLRDVAERRGTTIITQNGEAKAVVQDIRSFQEMQSSLALLKILAQSRKTAERGETKSLREAFREVRTRTARGGADE